MNIQLPLVLSDIVGESGKAIISTILRGERDAAKLAQLTIGAINRPTGQSR